MPINTNNFNNLFVAVSEAPRHGLKYKEIEQVVQQYEHPSIILKQIKKLEDEILVGIKDLEYMLED
jgi:hypothetical protein